MPRSKHSLYPCSSNSLSEIGGDHDLHRFPG
ncbi:hypothetical protein KP509_36G064200 [Ceratopteris richardii]|uniref:Uncharacterized protein n=1 Tax=Ceratopteris richardii TaxID=49495 RepID=A0A8T2QF60_CERRI|nr:hypothetical protein KP509_36G064200 [Ceratopteris richardii]